MLRPPRPQPPLVTLMGDDFKSSGGKNLTAMTLWSWSRVYGAPIDQCRAARGDADDRPALERVHRIDLRHSRAPPDREAARAAIFVGAEHRVRAALALAGDAQHTGRAVAADSSVSRPGHHGQHRPAGGHARLHAAPVQGGQQGRHDVGARCGSRLCGPGQRGYRGGLDDGPLCGTPAPSDCGKSVANAAPAGVAQ